MRLYVGGHEHSEKQRKFIDWLGGGITTSNPVEGDERVEAEWCKDLESSEVPLLEFEAGRNLQETETSDKVDWRQAEDSHRLEMSEDLR